MADSRIALALFQKMTKLHVTSFLCSQFLFDKGFHRTTLQTATEEAGRDISSLIAIKKKNIYRVGACPFAVLVRLNGLHWGSDKIQAAI